MGLDLYFLKVKKDFCDEIVFSRRSTWIQEKFPMLIDAVKSLEEYHYNVYSLNLIKSTYEDINEYDYAFGSFNEDDIWEGKMDLLTLSYKIIKEDKIVSGIDIPKSYIEYIDFCNKMYNEFEQFLYFRKMNHIHGWFVKNLQNGIDDCRVYKISISVIDKLLEELKHAMNNKKMSVDYFPMITGFCFGEYKYYDKCYMDSIRRLFDVFETIRNEMDFDVYNLYYEASW